jgi:hypothetical protein
MRGRTPSRFAALSPPKPYSHNLTFLPGGGGILGRNMARMMDQAQDQVQEEANQRAEIAKGPWKMNWNAVGVHHRVSGIPNDPVEQAKGVLTCMGLK